MEAYELPGLVRQIVREEFAPILMGILKDSTDKYRATIQRFPSEVPIDNQRIIQPFGLSSRPTDGMETLVTPLAGDPTHLITNGQNDINRPKTEKGESILYGADGQVIFMKNGGTIHQGSKAANEAAVLGYVLQEFLRNILDAFLGANNIGECAVGEVFLAPEIRTLFEQYKIKYVNDASTNILAQKIFVERGQ